jgi:hypothetical protein
MFVGYITNLIPSNSRSTALNFDHWWSFFRCFLGDYIDP